MANKIGEFFETLPDRNEALNDIANHLRKFWTPRMRSQLSDYVKNERGAGMKSIVLASIEKHIDFGINNWATFDNGETIANPR